MDKGDKIKELFAEQLGNHQTPVNPELWNAIASQIGTTAVAATSTGLSVVAKAIIGISAASVIGVGTYFITRDNEPQKEQITQLTEEESNSIEQEPKTTKESIETDNSVVTYKTETVTIEPQTVGNGFPQVFLEAETTSSEKLSKKSEAEELLDYRTGIINEVVAPVTNKPNSVGENPTSKPEKKNPIVDEPKKITENPAVVEPQRTTPLFELTHLPNVSGYNSNGYFSIGYNGTPSDFQFTVMDKNNKVIFTSDTPDFQWRGMDMSGNKVELGDYIYIITAKDANGVAINKYGYLTIINQ